MSTYTVEVRSGILTGNTRIHTYLYIKHPDGKEEAWGFYPADSSLSGLNGKGIVKNEFKDDDKVTSYNSSSGSMYLSKNQYNKLKNYIDSSIKNPPLYSFWFGSQCTTWALKGLAEADVIPKLLSTDMMPDNFVQDILESLIFNPFWQVIGFNVYNNRFNGAQNFQPRIDPLALDLNDDGVINTVGTDKGVLFDHNGDNIKTGTGWLQGGNNSDGLLVWDKNNNGLIDNGSELFGVDFIKQNGNKAKSGFDALADLDTNKDGIFDNKDNKFNQIKVWQDKNQDGLSQASELKTLSHYGITSIKLNSQAQNQDLQNSNKQTKVWRLAA